MRIYPASHIYTEHVPEGQYIRVYFSIEDAENRRSRFGGELLCEDYSGIADGLIKRVHKIEREYGTVGELKILNGEPALHGITAHNSRCYSLPEPIFEQVIDDFRRLQPDLQFTTGRRVVR